MKKVHLLCYTVLILSVTYVVHNSNDQYEQHLYTMKFERVEVFYINKYYYNDVKIRNSKYNRTYTISNITMDIKRDAGQNLHIIVQAYKFASNEYRLFPIRFMFDFCKALKNNYYGLGDLLKCGNYTQCPIRKGVYLICNFAPREDYYPPLIPAGSYKAEMTIIGNNTELLVIHGYATIKYPTEWQLL